MSDVTETGAVHKKTVTEEVLYYLLADVTDLNESAHLTVGHDSCDNLQNGTYRNMVILQLQWQTCWCQCAKFE